MLNREKLANLAKQHNDGEEYIRELQRKWFKRRLPRKIRRLAKQGKYSMCIYTDDDFITYKFLKELEEFAQSLGLDAKLCVNCCTWLYIGWKEK